MRKTDHPLPVQYPYHLSSVDETLQHTQTSVISIEQPITRLQDPYDIYDHDLIIQKVFMRSISGYPIPHLLLNNTEGNYFSIPLFGLISLMLGDRQCLLCSTTIDSDSYFPYCTACYNTPRFYGQMCRFEGPGAPFGISCTKENPPCIQMGGPTGCFKPHYLYVAAIGSFVKVGISSERRIAGRYVRLLEQGIRRAVVVRSFPSLHDAINAEKLVAGLLGLPQKITSFEKAQGIRQADEPLDLDDHWIHKKLIETFPDKTITGFHLYETPSFIKKAQITLQTIPPTILEGEIIYSMGQFILMTLEPTITLNAMEEPLVMFDSIKLQGHTIIPPEFS